jgi:hypothetical protein
MAWTSGVRHVNDAGSKIHLSSYGPRVLLPTQSQTRTVLEPSLLANPRLGLGCHDPDAEPPLNCSVMHVELRNSHDGVSAIGEGFEALAGSGGV